MIERDINQAERIAVLELEVDLLKEQLKTMNGKLDELLVLRHKGLGAFWLASTLFGTGIVGAVFAFYNYVRG